MDEQKNEYMHAIRSVGKILESYDSDQKFPMYGFGGKIPGIPNHTSHCFALNGDIYNPEVQGVEGMINAYRSSIQKAPLSGPTYFNNIINYTNGYCKGTKDEESQYNQKYNILLILTDGEILDMEKTINAIVDSSELPLSIIIIGVGSADFGAMEQLDADTQPLKSSRTNKYQTRDAVQFVPFRKFINDPVELTKQVLREVPKQMTTYFQQKGIKPNPADRSQAKWQALGAGTIAVQDNYFF